MDGNLTAMLVSLVIYIGSLGIASVKKINLKFIAVVAILSAFWFGYQWSTLLGILAVFAGMIVGVLLLKLLVGNKDA